MRFGKYGVAVEERGTGKRVDFELFETKQDQKNALEAARKKYPEGSFSVMKYVPSTREFGVQGMPLEMISEVEGLLRDSGVEVTDELKNKMKNLAYNYLPARSFLKQFKNRSGLAGYSEDVARSIAAYTQNAAGYIGRAEFGDALKGNIDLMRQRARRIQRLLPAEIKDNNRRGEMAEALEKHFKYIMEPGNEWAALRSLGFLWYLGYNVKSAVVNLTQVPFVTFPYLSYRYGTRKTAAALTQGALTAKNYFLNQGKISPEDKALIARGMEEGWLDESLATELALQGTEGVIYESLPLNFQDKSGMKGLRKMAKHAYYKLSHWGALPFHLVEKLNRVQTAVAAYKLAREAGADSELSSRRARQAVDSTQYEYARWNRPDFMRGKAGSIFLFKNYLQNTLFFLANDPAGMRALGMMALVGGLQGLPGAEDLLDALSSLITKGKEAAGAKAPYTDLRKELREETGEMLEALGAYPDLFMKGLAAHSFGLSALNAAGIPFPDLDLSASLSMGSIFPGDRTGQALKEGNAAEGIGRAVEEGGGALGALGMNLVEAAVSKDPDQWRRWEGVLPAAMANASKSLRLMANDGSLETRGGERVTSFDLDDPRSLAEVYAQGFGFTPRRSSLGWEAYLASRHEAAYYQIRKTAINTAFARAVEMKDREAQAEARKLVVEFNRSLPKYMKPLSITSESLNTAVKRYLTDRAMGNQGYAVRKQFILLKREMEEAFSANQEGGTQGSE
jgi:hypothetical protein